MELSVRSIQGKRGAKVYGEFVEDVRGMDWDGVLEPVSPATVKVTATNLGGRIGVEGRLSITVRLVCGRCMSPFTVELDETIQEFFARDDRQRHRRLEEEEVEGSESLADWFEREEAGERVYSGDVIPLDDLLRESVLLAIPMRPVCKESCLGLCPVCGSNRNENLCDCRQDAIDPRLATLRALLENGHRNSSPDDR